MMPFVSPAAASEASLETVALLRRLGKGEPEALDQIYRRESASVYRYALALSGNPAWAADAMQDAFVSLAARPQGFDPMRGTLGAYLAGIARHALMQRWREPGAPEPDTELATDEAQPSPEELLVRAQDQAQVWAAIRRLPWPQREALVLVDLQQRPYAEAAAIAAIEINTLRTRLHRARLRLAQDLNASRGEQR